MFTAYACVIRQMVQGEAIFGGLVEILKYIILDTFDCCIIECHVK